MAYQFLLEDLAGRARSDLPGATGKSFARAILGMSTGKVVVPLWDDQADFLMAGDALLHVIDTAVTPHANVFRGRLVTAEEQAGDGKATVAATFADGFWPLTKRLAGKSQAGVTYGTPSSPVAATAAISSAVSTTIAASPAGIRLGSVTATPATVNSGPHYYKKVSEIITELSAVLDGPDWRIDPIDTVASANPLLCNYCELVMAPSLGSVRLDQPWEYGDGRLNVKSYSRVVSNEGLLNNGYVLPAGFPGNTTGAVINAADATSQGNRGLFEEVITSDLTVDNLRQQLVNLHIAIRANPRQTITFDPVNDLSGERLPRLRYDYDVGDIMPFRVAVRTSTGALDKRVDALFRVFQVEVTVDERGVGQPKLTISPST